MMQRARVVGLALAVVLATTHIAVAQRGGAPGGRGAQAPAVTTLSGDVLSDLDRTRELVLNLVDAMPEDKFGFKPTPEQQSFGERAMHIVQADGFILATLGGKTAAPAINLKATSKADILAALRQNYDWQQALMKEFNDQQLVERITPPGFLGTSSSRVRVFYYSLQHTQDMYGQLVVYLRLNGITPPASRRGGI